MSSLVLQTAIGLIFVFGITAGAVSAATEAVSRFLGLRAEYLLRGVRAMVERAEHLWAVLAVGHAEVDRRP